MEFHFKITTWESVTVPEECQEEVYQAIKSGEITSSSDIFDFLQDQKEIDETECEVIEEVEEQMSVDENGGCSTIEILDENGNTVWGNGKG